MKWLRRSKPWRKPCFDSSSICSFPPNCSFEWNYRHANGPQRFSLFRDPACNLCIIMAIIINFIITFPSKRCHIPYARSIPRVCVIVRNIMEIFFEINSNYDPICPRMQRSGFELGSEICREWTRTGLQTILVSKVQFVGEREKRRDGGGGEKRERKGRKERVRPSHITAAHGDLWCDENYCRC